MPDGWCPFAAARPTANFGYPKGTRRQNRPLLFVDHIMDGWKRVLDDPAWREPAGVGVHFGIGRDGSISQYASIFDASWGNGVAGAANANDRRGIDRYDRSNRHLAALEARGEWQHTSSGWWLARDDGGRRVSVLNTASISIEHEGFPFDRDGFDATWPLAMIDATVALKRWCLAQLTELGTPLTVDAHLLVGHYQIDGVNRTNCPGPEWPRDRILEGLRERTNEGESDMPKLISPKGRREVYQVNGGSLEHVPDRATFDRLGYTQADVEQVENDDTLLALPVTYKGGVPKELR